VAEERRRGVNNTTQNALLEIFQVQVDFQLEVGPEPVSVSGVWKC
jgi:hypothetical protein